MDITEKENDRSIHFTNVDICVFKRNITESNLATYKKRIMHHYQESPGMQD